MADRAPAPDAGLRIESFVCLWCESSYNLECSNIPLNSGTSEIQINTFAASAVLVVFIYWFDLFFPPRAGEITFEHVPWVKPPVFEAFGNSPHENSNHTEVLLVVKSELLRHSDDSVVQDSTLLIKCSRVDASRLTPRSDPDFRTRWDVWRKEFHCAVIYTW